MSSYCTLDDVKMRLSGDNPTMSTAYDTVISDLIAEVSATIDNEVRQVRTQPDGWAFLPSAPVVRRYSGWPQSPLLLIDDAVAVSSVSLLDNSGNVLQTLTAASWQVRPLNWLPITGLYLTSLNFWPTNPGGVAVSMTPGYALEVPPDVRNATITEVIRSYRGGLAGEDDHLGIEPFNVGEVSKALRASTWKMIKRYRLGQGLLRGSF